MELQVAWLLQQIQPHFKTRILSSETVAQRQPPRARELSGLQRQIPLTLHRHVILIITTTTTILEDLVPTI